MNEKEGEMSIRFKATVLGHYDARLKGNEPHITVNLLAGSGEHLSYCGTLTMSEPEWEVLKGILTRGLKGGFEVDDPKSHTSG